ncbi:hypothetical protein [Streptomyces hypolithicus]
MGPLGRTLHQGHRSGRQTGKPKDEGTGGPAHPNSGPNRTTGRDVVSAAVLAINAALIGGEDLAWRPAPPSRARALLRKIAFNASVPVLALAYLVDRVSAPIGGGRGLSNTYRVLARRSS